MCTIFTNKYYPPSRCAVVALELLDIPYLEAKIPSFAPPAWMDACVWCNCYSREYPCLYIPPSQTQPSPMYISGTMNILYYLEMATHQLPFPWHPTDHQHMRQFFGSLLAMYSYSLLLITDIVKRPWLNDYHVYLRSRLWEWVQSIDGLLRTADAPNTGPAYGGSGYIGIAEIAGLVYTGPLHCFNNMFSLEPPRTQEFSRYYRWRDFGMGHSLFHTLVTSTETMLQDWDCMNDIRGYAGSNGISAPH
ncbi:hypothetical protein FBU59_006959 [Linderina macrospora]|uniref:Uncharacterized protein n=1 Tax=Linderina macrospora TaxID=4868 RepID=A0ACC1IYG7_9FUNG|nr:hypothetical protein FBU59_006959 [Linderina macrospora]